MFSPGSFLWFLAHDLRFSARNFEAAFHGRSRLGIAAILGVAALVTHGLAWPAAHWLELVGGWARR